MKVLVSGANGFVGSAVWRKLEATSGIQAVAGVRWTSHLAAASGDAVRASVALGDLSDAGDLSAALTGVDAVVHAAARVHVMRDKEIDPLAAFRRVNVQGTLNLARQAADAGVKRFIFLSSVKVNGEFTSPGRAFTEADAPSPQDAYGLSKFEAELALQRLALHTGMDVVIVRPPLVYGPGVKANFASLLRVVQRGWPLPLGAIHNQRSLVALDNLVDFILGCLRHPLAANQTFFVSDGCDLSIAELVQSLARAADRPARLLAVPAWALQGGAAVLGRSDAVRRLLGNLQVDISKAGALLGWAPVLSVDEGLRRVVAQGEAA